MIENKIIIKPPTLEDVIKVRGEDWSKVINFARNILSDKLLSDRQLVKLCSANAGVEETISAIKILYNDSKDRPTGASGIEIFFRIIDNSTYSLASWIEALHFFGQWLEKNNRQTTFPKMLGYLQCCEESPENKDIIFNFIDLIEEMLKEHGYNG